MSIEGEGPVLVADGEPMADSVFLAQYLDEAAGGSLQPTDPYARWEMEMWCRFIIERVAPAAALLGNRAHPDPEAPGDERRGFRGSGRGDRKRRSRRALAQGARRRLSRSADRGFARRRSGWRCSGSRGGSTATGYSAPSPSPTSKAMPGSPAWRRSCPRRSPTRRRRGRGLAGSRRAPSVQQGAGPVAKRRSAPGLGAGTRNQPLGLSR